jgi:ketosteroid isomerase-like protein
MTASELVEGVRHAFISGDLSALPALVTDDAEIRNPFTTVRGGRGFAELARGFTTGYTDRAIEVRRLLEAGDTATAELHVTARHAPSGRPIAFDELGVIRLEGGRIASWHSYYDAAALGRQIGEQPAFAG